MPDDWNDKQPIYKQLRERVVALIMDGSFVEGEAIQSVRSVSAELHVNHLTVAKAYQELVDLGVLEMRRGRGMYVMPEARKNLLADARSRFASDELPEFLQRAGQLGIGLADLIKMIEEQSK